MHDFDFFCLFAFHFYSILLEKWFFCHHRWLLLLLLLRGIWRSYQCHHDHHHRHRNTVGILTDCVPGLYGDFDLVLWKVNTNLFIVRWLRLLVTLNTNYPRAIVDCTTWFNPLAKMPPPPEQCHCTGPSFLTRPFSNIIDEISPPSPPIPLANECESLRDLEKVI